MTRSGFIGSVCWVAVCLLLAALLVWPAPMQADQAQYFYDELGRLTAVVDGQGNVAVYMYDAVGNLLSVQRFSAGGSGGAVGIFFFSPSSTLVGTVVQIQGFGFSSTAANSQLKFNGTPRTLTSAPTTPTRTTVPTGP